jgi:hypothetical protein
MAVRKKRKSSVYAGVKHPFNYELVFEGSGKRVVKKAFAKVKPAKRPVSLEITAPHVRQSIKARGAGSSSACVAAICMARTPEAFGHAVEGHVDFNYYRAFVVSKLDRTGLPAECYCYEHNRKDIAVLNDTPSGQKKLLAMIERDGPITLELKPYRTRSEPGRPGSHRPTVGTRSTRQIPAKGAKLRYAVMKLGAMPTDAA